MNRMYVAVALGLLAVLGPACEMREANKTEERPDAATVEDVSAPLQTRSDVADELALPPTSPSAVIAQGNFNDCACLDLSQVCYPANGHLNGYAWWGSYDYHYCYAYHYSFSCRHYVPVQYCG